jgi:hypothetical protein
MSALSGSKTTTFPWKNPNWFSKRIVERPEPSNRFEHAAMEFYKVAKASYRRARKKAAAAMEQAASGGTSSTETSLSR